ncbi:MAG: DUF308 domain-containing protein [Candidatus Lokiarchaeota archaeon]|nr:DUF308 domain-containing protein [Candidatus Lokiarchaeota archaeon]
MDEKSAKRRFQTSNILIGILMIFFSIIAIMYPEVTNLSVAFLLSIVLLITGLGRIVNASSDEKLTNLKAISRFISGAFALILSIVIILIIVSNPTQALDIWYLIVAIALLIIGGMRIILGIGSKKFDNWFRILTIIIGIVTVIFSILVLLIPELGGLYIIVLISISLLLNGIVRIILGIIGPK